MEREKLSEFWRPSSADQELLVVNMQSPCGVLSFFLCHLLVFTQLSSSLLFYGMSIDKLYSL